MTFPAWIAFSLAAPWLLRLGAFGRRSSGEAWFLAIQLHLVVLAVVSLALARAAVFEATLAAGLAFAIAGAVALAACATRVSDAPGPPCDGPRSSRATASLAVTLAACGALWGAFPTYHVFGGRDPGIYLLAAVRIVRTGGLDFSLPPRVLESVPIETVEDTGDQWFYPGIYSARLAVDRSAPRGEAVAQFLHLYSSLAAHAFATLGLEGLVRFNVALGLLALWSLARLVRAWVGEGWAVAAVATLGFSPAWIYAARVTMPEVHAAALSLLGLELLRLAWRDRSLALAATAGLVGGIGVACRMDSVLWVLACFGFALAAGPSGPAARRLSGAVLAGFAIAAGAALVNGLTFSWPYVAGQWRTEALRLPAAVVGATFGMGLCFASPLGALMQPRWLRGMALAAAVILAAWLGWGLLGRPHVWPKDFNARATIELGWYTSPWILALAAWGAIRLPLRAAPADDSPAAGAFDPPRAALLALAGGVLFAYTWRPGIFPDHPWASRRWVPFVIPVAALLAALGLKHLVTRAAAPALARLLAVLVVLATLVHHALFAAPFAFVSLYAGIPDGLAAAAARLPRDGRPAFATDPKVATALTYYYDRPVLLLTPAGLDALGSGALDGFAFVGRTPFHHNLASLDASGVAAGPALEQAARRWPRLVYEERFNLDTGTIRATGGLLDATAHPAHPGFVTRCGTRTPEGDVVSTGVGGVLLGGPYMRLGPGNYEVVWTGVLERNESAAERFGECRVDATTRAPDPERFNMVELLRDAISVGGPPRALATKRFQLRAVAEKVEFAVSVRDGVWLRLTEVAVRRIE